MEKCGKVCGPDHRTADGREGQGQIYSIDRAYGAAEMRACSACAGNYEDPDRTAWAPDDGEDEERDGAPRATTEELSGPIGGGKGGNDAKNSEK